MAKVSFSDLQVKRLRPPAKGQKSFWDSTLPGFGLRVSQGGSKTWIVLDPRSRTRTQETIGRYPLVSLQEARGEAKRRLAEATLGKYRPRAVSWDEAVKEYLDEIERTRKPRTLRDYKRMLDTHFKFRTTRLSEVRQQDIERKLGKLHDRASEYHHAFAVMRSFMKWAYRKSYVSTNPMERMKAPPIGKPRERVLTDEELAKIWNACEGTFGRLVKFLILSGQRRGEATSITPEMISGERLTLPAEIVKNGRTHSIPLSPLLKELIGDGLSWGGFSKSKVLLDKRAGVTGWTLHDCRRTFASNMARLGVKIEIVERLLNHQSGVFRGIVSVYQKYDFWDEMKDALEAWEKKVLAITQQPAL